MMIKHEIKNDLAKYLNNLKSKAEEALSSIDAGGQSKEYLRELIGFAISRSY